MDKIRLPIIMVAKREKDVLMTEGGGGDPPKYILNPLIPEQRAELEMKSTKLNADLENIESFVVHKSKDFECVPTVVKMKIDNKGISKSSRPHIRKLIDERNKDNVIGITDENDIIIKVDDINQLKGIKKRIKDIMNYNYGVSCVEEFVLNSVKVKTLEESIYYKIKLINFNMPYINQYIEKYFQHLCELNKLVYKKRDYSHDMIIYNVQVNSRNALATFENAEISNILISIEPMPIASIEFNSLDNEMHLDVISPEVGLNYPVIGVLDSGIANNKYLKEWIVGRQTFYTETDTDRNHGTFVAGIINYGDILENDKLTESIPCRLFDANVMPNSKKIVIYEDELLDNIKEAVRSNKQIKIWNMSLGTNTTADESSFSDFAIGLDSLQDECGILLIKSAGNYSGDLAMRISRPAESVRALTVGSIAQVNGVVKKNDRSPFSRVGRGPAQIIKPEVVHYGGNFDMAGHLKGVKSFGIDGSIITNSGTSFATPRVSSLAATLTDLIDGEFDPLLLKALIIHNSYYPIQTNDLYLRVKSFGFGKPVIAKDMLVNKPNEITMIMRDTLEKGVFYDIFQFPMPECLIKDGKYTGQIVVTLAYNQRLDATQGAEYCQSNIDVKLGTYDEIVDRDIEKSNMLKNPFGRSNSQNLLKKDIYSKNAMNKNMTDFSRYERNLINYEAKYYPIKKYTIDLSELTSSNEKKLLAGRKWYLQIKGNYRNEVELQAAQDGEILSQDYCLIVTLRGPLGNEPVYDETIAKLNAENFWHNTLKLNENININI